ncbi:hypothetical protein ACLMJK_004054 [Lecanora helva]
MLPAIKVLCACWIIGLFVENRIAFAQSVSNIEAPQTWQNLSSSLNTSTNGTNDLSFGLKYLVFPQISSKVTEIQNILLAHITSGSFFPFKSRLRSTFNGVEFWIVYATVAEIVAIARLLGQDAWVVRSTSRFEPQGTLSLNTTKGRSKSIQHQWSPSWDLSYVSWAPDVPFHNVHSYAFEEDVMQDTYIYVIEDGVDATHHEFTSMLNPRITWMFPPWGSKTSTDDAPGRWSSHGTCVASKAAGSNYGVAKDTNLVVLKATYDVEDVIWALVTAHKHISTNNRQRRAVVLFTYATDGSAAQDPEMVRIREIMGKLHDLDATIVVPSGNYARFTSQVSTVPAVWGTSDFPLIVVGGVQRTGFSSEISQGSSSDLAAFAPGENVLCATAGNGFSFLTGTSAASGMVDLPHCI